MRAARQAGDHHAARHAARSAHPRRLHVVPEASGRREEDLFGIPGGAGGFRCALVLTCSRWWLKVGPGGRSRGRLDRSRCFFYLSFLSFFVIACLCSSHVLSPECVARLARTSTTSPPPTRVAGAPSVRTFHTHASPERTLSGAKSCSGNCAY